MISRSYFLSLVKKILISKDSYDQLLENKYKHPKLAHFLLTNYLLLADVVSRLNLFTLKQKELRVPLQGTRQQTKSITSEQTSIHRLKLITTKHWTKSVLKYFYLKAKYVTRKEEKKS
ncbi:hypothetical protein BpHYR1_037409 [Brachionus plicatilis]|uniref:Uncharacterized protein n=1 Tax=Brachionus plicatilis TaxID=10195 RepID=A0A3M7SQ36_BRAPC|nr:hypothetical protein BpHYR1_037409 [Brachionus plicatilis]